MQTAMNNAAQQALIQLMTFQSIPFVHQFLVLNVSREHIVADTLRELTHVDSSDLKKPLRVSILIKFQYLKKNSKIIFI